MRPTCRAILLLLAIVVAVLPADAAITFKVTSLPVSLDSGDGTQVIALANVNKDSRLDILGINNATDGFDVFLNDGSGGFPSEPSASTTAGEGLIALASGDFDRDGNPDVVLVDNSAELAIFMFGDGTGNFGNEVDVPVSPGPVAVVVADLNNDGIVDAAVLSDAEIYLIRSNGNRTFAPFSPATVGTKGAGGFAITSGLLDGNAFPDLVVTNSQEAGTVSVLLGNGNGTFNTARLYSVGTNPEGLVVAKLDSDAAEDIAVVDSGALADLNVSLLYGNTDGTFKPDQRTTAGVDSVGVAAADFDQDGKMDLAVTNVQGSFGLATLRNDPQCSECPPPGCDCTNGFDLKEIPGFGDAEAVWAGDLNGDGWPDVVALGSDGSLGVFLNASGQVVPTDTPAATNTPTIVAPTSTPTPTPPPTASFTSTPTLTATQIPTQYGVCNTPVGGQPVALATGDFNRDSNMDIAVADKENGRIDLLLSHISAGTSPCAALGLSNGEPITGIASPVALAAEDLNGDGNLDLAVVGADGLSVFFGDGRGGFSAGPQKMQAGTTPHGIAIADLNRDGVPDIMVANQESDNVSIFIGDKGHPGSYQPACSIAVSRHATGIVTADLNRDGHADFAVFSDQTNDISVFLQIVPSGTPTPGNFCPSGTNGFRGLTPIGLSAIPRALVVNQFNQNDITPDFAVALSSGSTAIGQGEVFLGQAVGGTLAYDGLPAFAVSTRSQPSAIGAGDVNRDGRMDLVIADEKNETVVVFLGQGDGTFVALAPIGVQPNPTPGHPAAPVALVMSDIDGDGRSDTVVANVGDGSVSILITSQAPWTPTPPPTYTAVATGTPTATPTATFTLTAPPTASPTVTPSLTQTRTPTGVFTTTPVTPKPGTVSLNGSCAIDRQTRQGDWNGAAVLALALCGWLNRPCRRRCAELKPSDRH